MTARSKTIITYDFSNSITDIDVSGWHYIGWQLVDIIPEVRGACVFGLGILMEVVNQGATADTKVYYGLGDNSTTEPTWVLLNELVGDGTLYFPDLITVNPNKYLFIKIDVGCGKFDSDAADLTVTLKGGSIVLPCKGTAEAVGSPLTWVKSVVSDS